jgi:hypothetical protein
MSNPLVQLQEATVRRHCKILRMPTMAAQFSRLAEPAVREKKTSVGYRKRCWRSRSRSGSGTLLTGESGKLICRG